MSLLGDIVEHDAVPDAPNSPDPPCNVNGFPELYRPTKISSWKQRLREKGAQARAKEKKDNGVSCSKEPPSGSRQRSEALSIHNENLQVLQNMSKEEILRERQELLESFDPKLLQKLIKNINKKSKGDNAPLFADIDGAPGTWIGGTDSVNDLLPLDDDQVDQALGISTNKKPTVEDFLQEKEASSENASIERLDEDDVAPLDFQMAQSIDHMSNEELLNDVHFIKHENSQEIELEFQKLDLNDPDFNEKVHQKFFPDLPKDIEKLKWMEPLDDSDKPQVINDVSQCRFDFKGNLVPPTREIHSTTHSALHHHSDDANLAGYTMPELQRLSRSSFSAQRSIAIQTLGRILYKLGKQSYYQLVPEVDLETYQRDGGSKEVINKIYSMFWDLCKVCRISECLNDAADEKKTKHISVRNYAVDALWLWKSGGGDFRDK
ncbi:hypothetical protein HG535_0A00380 [Zygotorulaspora mrakii]|uniref:RNA polymerase II-associated protein RBA50 n=1 Tax=Zygotorulaspora mrakii TaxID=42260 RepID=A0A7H9AV20_ZYGMR|nr:uncharacterized protein HG535_0A00380 [Zygotorulaspora mrakii]QLG70098.1 hypothetical protein HG535_0A00380 [Zygotorulaspora mrakii]